MEEQYIDIHTHSVRKGVKSLLNYSIGIDREPTGELFGAGIHPWSAAEPEVGQWLDYLRTARISAVGETGLDYARNIDRDKQEKVFRAQLSIAADRRLPVIIHCVKAYNEALSILRDYELRAAIFHGYTGGVKQTEIILKRGYYLSFGEASLGSPKTVESLNITPPDRIFAETDTKNIAIEDIYACMAMIKQMTVERMQKTITENYKRIFG